MYVLVRRTFLLGLFFLFLSFISGCSTALEPDTDDVAEETIDDGLPFWTKSTPEGYTFKMQQHGAYLYWLPIDGPYVRNTQPQNLLHVSRDEGFSWDLAPRDSIGNIKLLVWDSNDHMIAVMAHGYRGVKLSKDNGHTFTQIADTSNGYLSPLTQSAFLPDNDRVWLLGDRGEIYESTTSSGYAEWKNVLSSPEEIRLIHRTSTGQLITGSTNGSIYLLSPAASWQLVKQGTTYYQPISSIIELPNNELPNNRILTSIEVREGSKNPGILLSDDDGLTWHEPAQGITGNRVESIFHHEESNTLFAIALNGVHTSIDNGDTWILHPKQLIHSSGHPFKIYRGMLSTNYLFIASGGHRGAHRTLISNLLETME